jgi:phosphoinositide-3-kinase regulatory subunit 4
MGNQTLVPSQIQTVESYFLDLKNYVQFKASLGSTTFMKTARVSLIEALIYEEFIANHHHQLNDNSTSQTSSFQATSDRHHSHASDTQKTLSSAANLNTSSAQFTNKLTQLQLFKTRMLELREQQQQVVVKVFPKYDASVRLDLYAKRVREIKSLVYTTYGLDTNLLPFSDLVITDRAAFLFRQYIKYNLYDRMSTRPFLTQCEKKWIAYQLLAAVNEVHSLSIVHGDIKPENVLVNSFLWVSLTDFASYKPVYLSKNHPSADFNYYFDISRRRTCYLAPERLEAPHQQNLSETDVLVDEVMPPDPSEFKSSMDIFSLGCVIAELFMERPLFDFAKLLAYRDNKYDPYNDLVNEIKNDKPLLDMILSMLSLDPRQRKSANEYLQEQNDRSFPSYFVYLKNYIKGSYKKRFLLNFS